MHLEGKTERARSPNLHSPEIPLIGRESSFCYSLQLGLFPIPSVFINTCQPIFFLRLDALIHKCTFGGTSTAIIKQIIPTV